MIHAAYENTQAAADALVRLYRQDDFATFDGRVNRPVLEAVAAGSSGGSAYFLDGETLRAVVEFGVGIGPRFEIDVEAPFLVQSGGAFDSAIDSYHAQLNLPDGGRPAFAKDRYVLGVVSDGETVFVDRAPGAPGPGDLVVSGRIALLQGGGRRPSLAGTLSAKLPTGSAGRLQGSGSADFGAALQITGRLGRARLHAGYGRVQPGDWALAPGIPIQPLRSLFGACAVPLSERNALLVQLLRTSGPFRYRSGSDLGRTAMEIAFGARHRLPHARFFEWGIIENLDAYQNTPDIGLFLGLTLETRTPVSSP